jgi:hypothetical protein
MSARAARSEATSEADAHERKILGTAHLESYLGTHRDNYETTGTIKRLRKGNSVKQDYQASLDTSASNDLPSKETIACFGLEDSVESLTVGMKSWSLFDLALRREIAFAEVGGKDAARRQIRHRALEIRRTLLTKGSLEVPLCSKNAEVESSSLRRMSLHSQSAVDD